MIEEVEVAREGEGEEDQELQEEMAHSQLDACAARDSNWVPERPS